MMYAVKVILKKKNTRHFVAVQNLGEKFVDESRKLVRTGVHLYLAFSWPTESITKSSRNQSVHLHFCWFKRRSELQVESGALPYQIQPLMGVKC
jgi:hypothetical protein